MSKLFFEDFYPGRVFESAGYELTPEKIERFRSAFDPATYGPAASPWHIGPIVARLCCDTFLLNSTSVGGPGVPAFSLNGEALAGSVLHCRTEVTSGRVSRSRPEIGFVQVHHDVSNGSGDPVARMDGDIMFLVRQPAAPVVRRDSVPAPATPPAGGGLSAEPAADVRTLAELVAGDQVALGSQVFTRDDIISFAGEFDPQDFHLSEGAAAETHFGALAASGWHVVSTVPRLMARRFGTTPRRVIDIRDLRWLRPVYAGDSLNFTVFLETADVRSEGGCWAGR